MVRKADSMSRAIDIMHEMFDVMYQCSEPSISWYEILDITDVGGVYSYMSHYLDIDECNGIYSEYKKKLSLYYARQLGCMFSNYAPESNPLKKRSRKEVIE